MNIQQFANLFNLSGIGLVLLISLVVLRKYPSPFFKHWIQGYAWSMAFVAMDALRSALHETSAILFAQTACVSIATWYFVQTGRELEGRPLRKRVFWIFLGGILLLQATLMAFRAPSIVVLGLPAFSYPLGLLWLSSRLLGRSTTPSRRSVPWVGWPMILLALWVLTYPFLASTPLFWMGFWISGLLQLLIGIGMVVYLLEETTEELRQKNRQLEQLNEMKTNFLSTVSHELRTPLSSIQGYMELIDDGLAGPVTHEQHDFLSHMKRAAGQLRGLIDALLDSVQLDAGELTIIREPFDLHAAILRDIETIRPLLDRKQLKLELALPDRMPEALADEQRVTQVLNNLLSNAAKFTPEGGSVRLSVSLEADALAVCVCDSGIGIPSEKLEEVFQPFVQVDGSLTRRYGGTGLGLSITRRLVEAMGGRVSLTSEVGRGTSVVFTLPLAPDVALRAQEVQSSHDASGIR